MIKVKCPNCRRDIEVASPGLYTCRVCKQVLRVEGRVQDRSILCPFVPNEPIPMMDATGKLAESQSHYLETYWKFVREIGWTQ